MIEVGDTDQTDATADNQEPSEQADAGAVPQIQPMTSMLPLPFTESSSLTHSTIQFSRHELLQLLSQTGAFPRLFRTQRGAHIVSLDGDEDDEHDGTYGSLRSRRRKQRRSSDVFPKVPSETGKELMESGVFGTNEREQGRYERKTKLSARIMRRELALESPGKQRSCNKLASQVSNELIRIQGSASES